MNTCKVRPGSRFVLGRGVSLARVIDWGPDEDLEKIEFAVLQAAACTAPASP